MIWSVVDAASAAPPAARSDAIRIGSTRSPAAATMLASAVPLVSRAAARVAARLGVAVAVDGVVARVGVIAERGGVDARVEHGDRRLPVEAGRLQGGLVGERHRLAGRRIRPPDRPHPHAARVQPRQILVLTVAANPFHTR